MARRGSRLGTSVLDLDVDDSRYYSKLDQTKRRTKSWTDGLGKQVKQGIGMGLGVGGGLLVAQGVSAAIGMVQDVVAGSINAAIEWESAFAGVRKTVDASEAEFEALEGGIRDMSKEIPIAATELAGLAEAAGALGIAKEDILEFTRVTALIGTTTDVSAQDAATSLGQLSNVLGLTADDYEKFGSTLVDLGNKGASTESQILGIASRAGAGAKLVGVATDATLGWASAVANLGIEVEAGGSALQTFFLRSAKAVSEGGDKLDVFAETAGMAATEFKTAFEHDATGALQTFLTALGKLSQGDQLKVLDELGFKDVRITRLLLGLAGNVDNLSASLGTANEAWEENGALAAEAAKRFDTTESKLTVLGNRVNDLAITFGDSLLPALVDLATFGVEQIEALVREIVFFADSVADTARWTQIYFGDIGATIERRANEIGEDVGGMKDAVLFAMNELGMELGDAMDYAERRLAGLPVAFDASMADTMNALKRTDLQGNVTGEVQGAVDGATAALLAGGIPAAAEEEFSAIDKEAQEARKAAVDAMKTMLDQITGLFDSETELTDAWKDLIDRMNDPYTEAERKAGIFSRQTIANIRSAIQSGDPGVVGDTATLVSGMLEQIETLEPGALAAGDAVPPALRDGMNSQMSALISWIETNVTGETLTAMSLEEADELGLRGMYLYAQGMQRNAILATTEARNAALRSKEAMQEPDFYGAGFGAGAGFMNGLIFAVNDQMWRAQAAVYNLANQWRDVFPGSEPKDASSPLRGITKAFGFNEILAGGLRDTSAIDRAMGGVASALLPAMPVVGLPALPGASRLGTAGLGGSSAELGAGGARLPMAGTTNVYQLHVGGKEIEVKNERDLARQWRRLESYDQ